MPLPLAVSAVQLSCFARFAPATTCAELSYVVILQCLAIQLYMASAVHPVCNAQGACSDDGDCRILHRGRRACAPECSAVLVCSPVSQKDVSRELQVATRVFSCVWQHDDLMKIECASSELSWKLLRGRRAIHNPFSFYPSLPQPASEKRQLQCLNHVALR